MKLSIIIPVFNEEKTIQSVIRKVFQLELPGVEKEIVVVDDGSTDSTPSVISNFKFPSGPSLRAWPDSNFKVIRHDKNLGKGKAVRTGIAKATGDYLIIQDADLEYNPHDIKRLLVRISKDNKTAVYGSRLNRLPNFLRDERTPRFLLHYIGNRMLSLLASILYGQWITDMETGYKLFPKKAVKDIRLTAKSFDFEPELTAKLLKKGYKILETPISTNPRGYKEGKKLNTIRDGAVALWTLVKYRLVD